MKLVTVPILVFVCYIVGRKYCIDCTDELVVLHLAKNNRYLNKTYNPVQT